jgi:hypothetical protein
MARADATDLYKIGDTVGDDACLTRARPGQYQHGAGYGFYCFFLGGIEVGKDIGHEIFIIAV